MKIKKIRDVKTPVRGTSKSAGIDFFIPNDWNNSNGKQLWPGDSVLIPSGVIVEIPENYVGVFFNKSGVASKKRLQVGACVIDEDYQGEVHLNLINIGVDSISIYPGEKIAQMLLLQVLYDCITEVDIIHENKTERGTEGFGHTGNN